MLLYPLVCPAKYRKAVFTEEVSRELKVICHEIAERYEVGFLERGADKDYVHFLVQSVAMYSPTPLVRMVKSLTAKELFKRIPRVKKQLGGGAVWSSG